MGKRVKVLHISLSHGGGVEVYVRMLLQNSCDEYETILICSPKFDQKLLPDSLKAIYELNCPRKISLIQDLIIMRKIRKIIKKERPDIVYCHSSMAGALGRIASWKQNCKVLYNAHGWSFGMKTSNLKKKVYIFIERSLSKYTDQIISISEYEKQLAVDNRICPKNKIQVIMNGVNLEPCCSQCSITRQELKIADNDFVIGCVARISDQKAPLMFAKVAGLIKAEIPEAHFIWVGDGELKNEFIQELKENNVYYDTTITGWVDNPNAYIELFDVAVLFSKWEGFGLVLAEYMAHGKPVVATNVDAIPEVICDGRNGRLIPDATPGSLAYAVMQYYDCENIDEIKENCIVDSKRFDIHNTADKTKELFKRIIEGKD